MKKYNLVVVGSGSGGSSVAYACKEAGWNVAIIDKQPFGGTCALRGCNPKKVLVGAADLMDHKKRMEGLGISQESSVQWNALMQFKNTFTEPIPENSMKRFQENGIDVYQGVAQFIGEDQIKINGQVLVSDKFLIAAGSKPRMLHFNGNELIKTSDDFLELKELPKRIVFVGGGYISFEFASIARSAGAEVIIIQRGSQVLKEFEQELVNALVDTFKQRGITIAFDTTIEVIEKQNNELIVNTLDNNKKRNRIVCDAVFHGAGRVADINDLNLEKANVLYSDKGVEVNDFLQSFKNPKVYAAGDAANTKGLDLTPVASMEARVVTHNLLNNQKIKPDYKVMASVVFTQPRLAMVGITEKEALKQKIMIEVKNVDTSSWFTYKYTNEHHALFKLILNKVTDKIVGVHILGGNADDLINHFAMIMTFDLAFDKVKEINFAYPSSAYDLKHLL